MADLTQVSPGGQVPEDQRDSIQEKEATAVASVETSNTAPGSGPEDVSHLESPSLSTPSARARFEFEPSRGSYGTKVLMVEWEEDDSTFNIAGQWIVGWENKSHVLPAEERCASSPESDQSVDSVTSAVAPRQASHRLYFLLPSRKQIPATVTLTLQPLDNSFAPVVWKTNPLPAIFPPGLDNREGIKKGRGVLHTLWAKKRLQALEKEIEDEASLNCEGIALQMAIGERDWILENFGLSTNTPPTLQINPSVQEVLSPMTPLSPGGARLTEKLRGLKLQTSPGQKTEPSLTSPEEADVAVPLCRKKREKLATDHTEAPAAEPVKVPTPAVETPPARFFTPASTASMLSLESVLSGQSLVTDQRPLADHDEEADLFALALSPRSPAVPKGPFSFASEDTARYLEVQGVS